MSFQRNVWLAGLVYTFALMAPVLGVAGAEIPQKAQDYIKGPFNELPAEIGSEDFVDWMYENMPEQALSPYIDDLNEWLEENRTSDLPKEVYADKNKIHVDVSRAIAVTDELEDSNDIPLGRAMGSDIYAEIDADVETVLQAWKFKYGLPPQASESGTTYPHDDLFNKIRRESFLPLKRFGAGVYLNIMERDSHTVVKAVNNLNMVVIRGDAAQGYTIMFHFIMPFAETTTSSSMSYILMKPLPGGKTAYKIATRHIGQNYWFSSVVGNLGWQYVKKKLRDNFGFKVSSIYEIQKGLHEMVTELKSSGDIKGRHPHEAIR